MEEYAVPRFGQHTRLVATTGQVEALVAKFLEAVEIQRDNPACELTLVSRSSDDPDVVYITEVWSSEDDWDEARRSEPIAAWAKGMAGMVAGPPESHQFEPVGGKGL